MKSNGNKRTLMKLLLLPVMILLSGCNGEISRAIYVSSCPALVGYTAEEQADVAAKKAANQHETWARMIDDYGRLRAEIRKNCQNV